MKIRKIQVARGVHWIEVPEADLRVLCGCPADSVKHLIKRGLIVPQEVQGVPCETGPNAILLSDLMLQNGEFANLAEFPVLQMLYRQGLLIPNHPNATGDKPILIGLAEQVNAQMQYIYRGNYGLVSKEEIMETGFTEAEAEEMMRLKLKFAFGSIRPTSELLASCVVPDGDPVEVKGGVTVRRLATNVFEFAIGDETATVDLNLSPGEKFEAAYPLGFGKFERDYFSVIHSGEGDGWDPNRPSMASVLVFQGKTYLVDAGPNLNYSLNALGISIDEIEGLFHTHAHDDHFAGITTLMRAGHRIKYYATPLVRATVEKKLGALLSMEEERFADFFDIHDLTFDEWSDIDGLEVMPLGSPHPVETNIFVFRTLWADGYRSYAHFADIVSLEVLERMVTDKADEPGLTRDAFERTVADYKVATDVKKLDIGGGMIHGAAVDFRDDPSTKILLAHKSEDLTPAEKEIGSSATFGAGDVLISGTSDFLRRRAWRYIASHFPGAPMHHMRTLLNHDIADVNPGVIVLREGEVPENVFIILNGAMEKIRTKDDFLSVQSAGAVIGELPALKEEAAAYTYRAATFVQALKIPVTLYREIVKRNGLLEKIVETSGVRFFLESTGLFGESVPAAMLTNIVSQAEVRKFKAGDTIGCQDLQVLNLVRSGTVERSVGSEVIDVLGPRDFFGEEGAVFRIPCLYHLKVLEDTEVYQIPGDLADEVPIVRWKLLESYLKRATRIIHAGNENEVFVWREAFGIEVLKMDTHHKRLFEIANGITEILRSKGDPISLGKAMDALVEYTHYHFEAEEALMEQYGYPDTEAHKKAHARLVKQVTDYRRAIADGDVPDVSAFRLFFDDWLVKHILSEDRKYGAFLNSRGVF